MPNEFFARAEGHIAGKVTINWLGVKAGLEASIDTLAQGRASHLTVKRLGEIRRYRATNAALYILEFLPEVIDSAIANLYLEAFLKLSVDARRPLARSTAEVLSKMDYEARVKRLGIHEGPKPRFQHRSQYEAALTKAIYELLREGRDITQETVADKLSVESEDPLDARVIRRWNGEFGVNWKVIVKRAKRTSLS
jgi:hypothetical protein